MAKIKSGREISLYDIEQFFKDAGAERINENAVKRLKSDLEESAREIIDDALVYANYAGRRSLVKKEDVMLTGSSSRLVRHRRLSISKHGRRLPIEVPQQSSVVAPVIQKVVEIATVAPIAEAVISPPEP